MGSFNDACQRTLRVRSRAKILDTTRGHCVCFDCQSLAKYLLELKVLGKQS
jgi:hypothetical protein